MGFAGAEKPQLARTAHTGAGRVLDAHQIPSWFDYHAEDVVAEVAIVGRVCRQ